MVDYCKTQGLSISLRTAQRYIKRGCLPSLKRTPGRDGKTYPRKTRQSRSKVARELLLAKQALNRADRKACDGFHQCDIEALEKISGQVLEILGRWRRAA